MTDKCEKVPANPNNSAVGAPNVNVVITYNVGRITLGTIIWSYSVQELVGGRLTVAGGGWNFDVDITVGGPGFLPFDFGEYAVDGNPVVVTLYAAGALAVGKLNVMGRGVV